MKLDWTRGSIGMKFSPVHDTTIAFASTSSSVISSSRYSQRETEAAEDGYFRKEWQWALERSDALDSGSRFVLPVCIDDCGPQNIPASLRKFPTQSAPGGQPTPDFVNDCVTTVRQTRARRAL
jgi:hypothetical protein